MHRPPERAGDDAGFPEGVHHRARRPVELDGVHPERGAAFGRFGVGLDDA